MNRLREFRLALGMSQRQLAEAAWPGHRKGAMISVYERGEDRPTARTAEAIAKAVSEASGVIVTADMIFTSPEDYWVWGISRSHAPLSREQMAANVRALLAQEQTHD